MYMDEQTQKTLAKNLDMLMNNNEKITQEALCERSGVDQKTISNVLNPGVTKKGPTLKTITLLANSFGLETWHILVPNQTIETLLSKSVEKLVSNYNTIDESGRQNISRISENEMRYCTNHPDNPNQKISNGN